MSEKVISQEELQEINERKNIIMHKQTMINLLSREFRLYQSELTEKYKLDPKKLYKIDNRGVITENIKYIKKPVEVKKDVK